jgi:hypothetical protein
VSDVNAFPQSSSKKQPAFPARFVQISGRRIPTELAWLVTANGLQIPALYKLMKLAREAGHRLSSIVSAAEHALKLLKGRELFAYISALASKPVDFDFAAAQRADAAAVSQREASEKKAREERIAALVAAYRGHTVIDPDGTEFTVDSVSVCAVYRGQSYSATHERGLEWLEKMDRVARGVDRAAAKLKPALDAAANLEAHLTTLRALTKPRWVGALRGA